MVNVAIDTNKGVIRLELDHNKAPVTVDNFLEYARSGFYDNTIFHRVIAGFMIQGGGYDTDTKHKATRAPIKNEARNGLKNTKGSIAMARTSVPDSATSQFFINTVDNPNLDYPQPDGHGYAVFGRVIEGMDTVEEIEKVKTGVNFGMRDVPLSEVVIRKVTVEE